VAAIAAFDAKLAGVGGTIGGGRRGRAPGAGAPAAGTPPPPNFVGVNGALIRLLETLDFGDMAPNEPMRNAYVSACTGLRPAVENWVAFNANDLSAFNAVLSANRLDPIAAASPLPAAPICGATP